MEWGGGEKDWDLDAPAGLENFEEQLGLWPGITCMKVDKASLQGWAAWNLIPMWQILVVAAQN